jgi:catechol 2,3-dioxygenase-like lactoylglutathione lyase family enzyme
MTPDAAASGLDDRDPEPLGWPGHLPVARVRVARPTDQLDAVVAFYRDALGLPEIASFRDHAGYSGVMIGLPGLEYHLEFTTHEEGSACPAPSRDNLLVLYIPDAEAISHILERLAARGHHPVEPENPYWANDGVTVEDPDGWRLVLQHSPGLG